MSKNNFIHLNKIIYIKNLTNKGFPGGINQGLKVAFSNNSKFVILTNNDVEFYPQSINELLKGIQTSNYGYVTAVDKERNWKIVKKDYIKALQYYSLSKEGMTEEEAKKGFWWEGKCMSCYISKKEFFDRVGYYDENLFPGNLDDFDLQYRAALLGIEGKAYIPALIEHSHAATQIKYNFNSGEIMTKNKNYLFNKWGKNLGWV